jgi:integrase/recombinase XerD
MKPARPSELGKSLVAFFGNYLPIMRGLSQHSIRSYRDAVVLFLRFCADHTGRGVEDLDLADVTAEHVGHFLAFLEDSRHNSVATRNARLAALHTLARFLAPDYPGHLAELQRIPGIPFKRGARQAPIEYFEPEEVKALLDQIDCTTDLGRRDYALFALMFNTGARVQEVLDLRPCDVRTEPPCQVRVMGKGAKVRLCPIWPHTAKLLDQLARRSAHPDGNEAPLFQNRHGTQLTRFGVGYLLRKYIAGAAEVVGTLAEKRLHPHSLRHTTAIALLKAGVDFATISQWLGHASLNTTMVYARADLDLKRQALAQVFPDVLPLPKAGHLAIPERDLVSWLRRL